MTKLEDKCIFKIIEEDEEKNGKRGEYILALQNFLSHRDCRSCDGFLQTCGAYYTQKRKKDDT